MTKVLVAMSGGVDSSVAAALLKDQGYRVIGVTMKIWGGETPTKMGRRHGCYGPSEREDIEDASNVAQILGLPFYVFDLTKEYKSRILDHFCHEYLSGRTPNPCIQCNRWIKFETLGKKAWDSGIEFDYFATGHYARVDYDESRGRYLLKRARDSTQDQSYFLSSLPQEWLGPSLFPVGDFTKEEVRKMASHFRLGLNSKPESQDFVRGGYASLIRAAARPGPILDRQGNILGQHKGISFYTIGQRKGLGISASKPLYVTRISPEKNAIVVGDKEDLYGDELIASELNWIAVDKLRQPTRLEVKIRYAHSEAEAVVVPLDGDKVYVKFRQPQMAIAPGQSVVFYDDETVIGGGIIERAGQP